MRAGDDKPWRPGEPPAGEFTQAVIMKDGDEVIINGVLVGVVRDSMPQIDVVKILTEERPAAPEPVACTACNTIGHQPCCPRRTR